MCRLGAPARIDVPTSGVDGSAGFIVLYCSKNPHSTTQHASGAGAMIDRAASLQPAKAPKQQVPLAHCKGRGWFPAHAEGVCVAVLRSGGLKFVRLIPHGTTPQSRLLNLETLVASLLLQAASITEGCISQNRFCDCVCAAVFLCSLIRVG